MFDKLRNFLSRKLILKDQELAYLELLKVELAKESTTKCTPPVGAWYVKNSEDQRIFRIGGGSVAFAGPTGTAQFDCPLEVSDKFRDVIEERLRQEAQTLENDIREKELKVFEIDEQVSEI